MDYFFASVAGVSSTSMMVAEGVVAAARAFGVLVELVVGTGQHLDTLCLPLSQNRQRLLSMRHRFSCRVSLPSLPNLSERSGLDVPLSVFLSFFQLEPEGELP